MSRDVYDGSGERGGEEGSLGSGSQTKSLTDVGEVKVTPAGTGYGLRRAREASDPQGGPNSPSRSSIKTVFPAWTVPLTSTHTSRWALDISTAPVQEQTCALPPSHPNLVPPLVLCISAPLLVAQASNLGSCPGLFSSISCFQSIINIMISGLTYPDIPRI